jgi:hypothetical protein
VELIREVAAAFMVAPLMLHFEPTMLVEVKTEWPVSATTAFAG